MTGREYVVYEETTSWPWWGVAILIVAVTAGAAATVGDVAGGLALGRVDLVVRGLLFAGMVLALGAAVRTLFGRLRVRVTRTSVKLEFGYTSLVEKLITFDEIEEVEAMRYSPLREFGGWGIRFGGGRRRAWTLRGDGAVVLTLDDGTRFYVGSESPRTLAEHIRGAMEARGPARTEEREET